MHPSLDHSEPRGVSGDSGCDASRGRVHEPAQAIAQRRDYRRRGGGFARGRPFRYIGFAFES
jgi:hypothetical protein